MLWPQSNTTFFKKVYLPHSAADIKFALFQFSLFDTRWSFSSYSGATSLCSHLANQPPKICVQFANKTNIHF